MAELRSWLRRLERLTSADMITLEQLDGTTKTFAAEAFWHQLFLDQLDAATGVTPDSPVAEAMEGATPKARASIERTVASGGAGVFLRGNGGDDEARLLEVANDVPDLSEPA
jgi:hypothetical protein